MVRTAAFSKVRASLIAIFGPDGVHFTSRREGATFPCAVYTQDAETLLASISDTHIVVNITVGVEVQAKTAREAMAMSDEVRAALAKAPNPAVRTSFDIEELDTEEQEQAPGDPSSLFSAVSTYTVYN